jgi:hypothetical protein
MEKTASKQSRPLAFMCIVFHLSFPYVLSLSPLSSDPYSHTTLLKRLHRRYSAPLALCVILVPAQQLTRLRGPALACRSTQRGCSAPRPPPPTTQHHRISSCTARRCWCAPADNPPERTSTKSNAPRRSSCPCWPHWGHPAHRLLQRLTGPGSRSTVAAR